jgi:D-glycero-D-manno-heptose 1,7-bisphosphate phosphatase
MPDHINRALFLDRDGVVNIEKNYVHRIEDFEFVPGIMDLCACALTLGFRIIIITNQAGIARGYYTVRDYDRLTDWMLNQFSLHDIHIERVYYCPFHPTAGLGRYKHDSYDRKPNPGMILKAREEFNLALPDSVLIGDKDTDIMAGLAAGVGYNVLLSGSLGDMEDSECLHYSSLPDITAWLAGKFRQPR